jgi:hypothetical protein
LSYSNLFLFISKTLLVNLKTFNHNLNKEYFLISVSSQKARIVLVDYLDKHPLFTSKFLNYKDWCECHYLIKNKNHLNNKGINTALLIKSRMNNKRVYYNWDHLALLDTY